MFKNAILVTFDNAFAKKTSSKWPSNSTCEDDIFKMAAIKHYILPARDSQDDIFKIAATKPFILPAIATARVIYIAASNHNTMMEKSPHTENMMRVPLL